MSTVRCPGCGGQFPLAAVAQYETFTCSKCGHVVEVPAAPPAQRTSPARPAAKRTQPTGARSAQASTGRRAGAGRTAKPASRRTAPPPEPEPEPRGRSRGKQRRTRSDDAPRNEKKALPVPMLAGGGLLVVAVIAFFMMKGGDELPPATIVGGSPVADGTGVAAGSGDPDKDPAAWTMLAANVRADRVNMMVARANTESDSVVQETATFLRDRKESEGLERLARLYVARTPTSEWANQVLGREEVSSKARRVLRKCELADDVQLESVVRLGRLIKKHAGDNGKKKWWAEGDELKEVNALLAEVEAGEQELANSDAAFGRARWITYRRTVEVFKDHPTLSAHVGPYLIFVQIKSEKGTVIEDADPEAVATAQVILDRNIDLFKNLYEGWMTQIAPIFGFERYTEDSVDYSTILKANVFADSESYYEYIAQVGGPRSARAYYSKQEPRFITTYEGDGEKGADGEGESQESTNQVQCHEATHQLVHFYTWDTTRKIIGRPPRWLDSLTRPLWSTEGFAEFFSSHTEENGKYTWMVPLEDRMKQLWVFSEVIEKKGWTPWALKDIWSLRHGGQLSGLAQARAIDPNDAGASGMVMSNQFYAEAWSWVYFLWNVEEGGKLKYRDKLIAYFKLEFELDFGQRDGKKRTSPRLMQENDFRGVFGLIEAPKKEQALYDEWKVFEKALVEKHRNPKWNKERERIFKMLKMDPAK